MSAIEVIPKDVRFVEIPKSIGPSIVECLFYDFIDIESGEYFSGSAISLDKKYIKISRPYSEWFSLSFDEEMKLFYINMPHRRRQEIADEVIAAIDSVLLERYLLDEYSTGQK